MSESIGGTFAGVHAHGFISNEDRRGRRWRAGRVFLWLSRAAKQETDDKVTVNPSIEWTLLPERLVQSLGLKVSTSGEETLDVHLYLGPLANIYLALNLDRPGYKRLRLWPRFRFQLQLRLAGIDWCFGPDDRGWSRNASWAERLRRNRLRWFKGGWRRRENATVATTEVVVPLPEGIVPATATLERGVWNFEVGPYGLTRRSTRRLRFWLPVLRRVHWSATIDARSGEGLPFPGKGENAWDCGPDAIRSISIAIDPPPHPLSIKDGRPGEWTAKAIGHAVQATLRNRVRYGRGITDTGRSESTA